MNENEEETKFVVKSYLKADLAHLYHPNLPIPYAMCKLRGWIRKNKELHSLLYQCGGGIFWKKNPLHYKNSIANNLFSLTAIRLYKATQNPAYLDWFKKNVDWYTQTGMINTDIYQIEDGTKDDCTPNRNAHYTYNQGVAIAVLAEM